MIPQFFLRFHSLKITCKKNILSTSEVLISYEIEISTEEVHLKLQDDITFWFLQITLKIGF